MRQKKTDKYREIEGRGNGKGVEYKPWLKVHEIIDSKGRAHRILGWKHQRVYQLMSDNEFYYFLIMQWQDNVIDIREQFPLKPLEMTLDIADRYNITHGPKNSDNKTVMTTDFVITLKTEQMITEIARTIKPLKEMQNKRVVEKLMIEEEYWKIKKFNWGVVTDDKIPKTMAINIFWIYDFYFWDKYKGLEMELVEELAKILKEMLCKNDNDILRACYELENLVSWESGEGLNFFKYMITHKKIQTNMNKVFNFKTMEIWY